MPVSPLIKPIVLAILTTAMTACADATDVNDAAPASSLSTARTDCSRSTPEFAAAFRNYGGEYRNTPICFADVGPGLDSPEVGPEFSSVVAGEMTNVSIQGPNKPLLVLAAFVGTLKSGDGATWVARYISRLGRNAANGTVKVAGRTAQFIDLTPGGPRGYAYGDGKTVVVAYIKPPLGTPSHPLTPTETGTVFTHIIENTTIPVPNEKTENSVFERFPLARGNFTTSTDPGWIYFRSDHTGNAAIFCGMSPGGDVVGCDIGFALERAPAGTNQIILDSSGLRYAHSDEPTFTRSSADIAYLGERLENGPAVCAMTDQAPMVCRIVADDGSVRGGAFR